MPVLSNVHATRRPLKRHSRIALQNGPFINQTKQKKSHSHTAQIKAGPIIVMADGYVILGGLLEA